MAYGTSGSSTDGPSGADATVGDGAFPPDALVVHGNKIVHAGDGTRFHGCGADLHDTRSCEANFPRTAFGDQIFNHFATAW